jgi:thioredoxin-related protein
MKRLLSLVVFFPFFAIGQSDTIESEIDTHAIHFEQGKTWQQILEEAESENKYIFVDYYATWCVPCKQMDKNVYTKRDVGDFINYKFIAVKVQEDTSSQDNDGVRKWYETAHDMFKSYNVTALPAYLFFSPDGKIVHRDFGGMDVKDFISLAHGAINPDSQYYSLKEKYNHKMISYALMPYLALTARRLRENEFAITVAQDYLQNYLYKFNEEALYTKEDINLIATFIQSTKERSFNMFYRNADKVDQIMWKGYAEYEVDYLITKEEIDPFLHVTKGNIPNWSKMATSIRRKYNADYSSRNILNAKVNWYKNQRYWAEYTKYAILQAEKSKFDTTNFLSDVGLNNVVWDVIFLHSTKKEEMEKGLQWMKGIVRRHPDYVASVDTYANLLYKLGKKKSAIVFEEKAVELNKNPNDKSFQETLDKMRNGQKTWD